MRRLKTAPSNQKDKAKSSMKYLSQMFPSDKNAGFFTYETHQRSLFKGTIKGAHTLLMRRQPPPADDLGMGMGMARAGHLNMDGCSTCSWQRFRFIKEVMKEDSFIVWQGKVNKRKRMNASAFRKK